MAAEFEQFLYREANLLDDRRFDEWLALLTDDVAYCVPNFSDSSDLSTSGVIVYERMPQLKERVARALHPRSPTQLPPPRTRHFITNVVATSDGSDTASVAANLLIYIAKDGRMFHHAGKTEHDLRKAEGHWRIAEKRVFLIENDQPLTTLPIL